MHTIDDTWLVATEVTLGRDPNDPETLPPFQVQVVAIPDPYFLEAGLRPGQGIFEWGDSQYDLVGYDEDESRQPKDVLIRYLNEEFKLWDLGASEYLARQAGEWIFHNLQVPSFGSGPKLMHLDQIQHGKAVILMGGAGFGFGAGVAAQSGAPLTHVALTAVITGGIGAGWTVVIKVLGPPADAIGQRLKHVLTR